MNRKELPKRRFGKTGYEIGIFSLGGESTVQQEDMEELALEIINKAIDLGVNYIDTSPQYGSGGSEKNIGKVMKYRRKEVFLATKTHDRTYDGTMRLLEESLKKLQTDYLDLYQIHDIQSSEETSKALSKNGAVKAMEKMKSQGVIKHCGITSHKDPEALLLGIKEYDFDCVLMSLNAADIYYKPFCKNVLETAVEKEMGIIAMKSTAVGRIFKKDGINSMKDALGYVLTYPISTVIVGITTLDELEENIQISQELEPFPKEKMEYLEKITEKHSREGNFFKYEW